MRSASSKWALGTELVENWGVWEGSLGSSVDVPFVGAWSWSCGTQAAVQLSFPGSGFHYVIEELELKFLQCRETSENTNNGDCSYHVGCSSEQLWLLQRHQLFKRNRRLTGGKLSVVTSCEVNLNSTSCGIAGGEGSLRAPRLSGGVGWSVLTAADSRETRLSIFSSNLAVLLNVC